MTTNAICEERGSDWSHQVSVVATTRWLQCDQTLPLSVKGVACKTSDMYMYKMKMGFFPKCQLPKCQLPKCQLPKMSTPKMSTPKMSTPKSFIYLL